VLDGVATGVCDEDASDEVGAELLENEDDSVEAGAGVGSTRIVETTLVIVGTMAVICTVFVLVFSSTTVVVASGGGADVDPPSTLTIEYDFARGTFARGFNAPSRGRALEKVEIQSIKAR
jgi:hypothetical protein